MHRAGGKNLVLPRHNRRDLGDIPGELRTDRTFLAVDTVDEVIALPLVPLEPLTGTT